MQGYLSRHFSGDSVAWAVNFGGDAYQDPVGVMFEADPQGPGATVRGMVDGTQKTDVFDSYRRGPQDIVRALPDGVYDLTFLFTEPDGLAVGERVFDVFVQGRTVLEALDVKQARWGPSAIALHRTVPGVVVTGGELRVQLKGRVGQPVINGLIVRSGQPEERDWELVWSDEFGDSGRPDVQRWTPELWEPGRVNNERQAYTDALENARVEGGVLILEAHRTPAAEVPYTSARLHSRGALDIRYGRVDIRARLPAGQGTWAALWMLPSDPHRYASSCQRNEDWQGAGAACDAWPNSGEIDIMEYVGYDPDTVHGSVHTAEGFGGQGVTASVEVATIEEEFHIYSLVWEEDRLHVLIDGVPFFSYFNAGEGWRTWPFDHAFHLVFNLAVGGSWGEAGGPVDDRIFPARFEIDYVRVYKRAGATEVAGRAE